MRSDAAGSDAGGDRGDETVDATPCAYTEYVRGGDVDDLPATGEEATGLERAVWDALYDVEDPEMPVSIVDLGLIYGLELEERSDAEDGDESDGGEGADRAESAGVLATVLMTLTYTGCPARNMLLADVREAVESVAGVDAAEVELVWSPEWSLEMVTEDGRADLREFGLSVPS